MLVGVLDHGTRRESRREARDGHPPGLQKIGQIGGRRFSFGGWVDGDFAVAEGVPETPVLDAISPDAALVAAVDNMLVNFPDGWGQVDVVGLNEALVENPDTVLIDVRRADEVEEMTDSETENNE